MTLTTKEIQVRLNGQAIPAKGIEFIDVGHFSGESDRYLIIDTPGLPERGVHHVLIAISNGPTIEGDAEACIHWNHIVDKYQVWFTTDGLTFKSTHGL